MAALKQVKETQGMALSPDLDAMETAGMQTSWPSSASSSMESAMQWITPTSGVPIRPRVSTQDIPARTPTGSVGVVGSGKYDAIIQKASQRYGVDSDLIRSVIKVESSFNPRAVSPSGAKGMMQLMPGTAKELGVKDPFDPEQNIMGGTAYLSRLLDRYDGNVRSALAAYNWGMGNLEKKPMAAMPGETRQYVSRIMGMMDGDAAV
ncbi:MAG: lytic transglycosylase domain-containing protein [Magnetococcales bacterium]|nr:lytic transglycosylase domain-containing protein [Magnetococcales bacterium]MBF0151456.1 lytic transglycosylase domain-containing protein [Magnetococcales bacterium]MBF0174409.1 lytic transglycosylase domain-containing protein [Magnetococcales bacterium]MBF0348434.1 lytic transglycosylase domain-containing protein [Magnetococcales bacterium]MBF0632470.1 lytic transglycosylase domain-containing protein [Magnetococcales bacterium]